MVCWDGVCDCDVKCVSSPLTMHQIVFYAHAHKYKFLLASKNTTTSISYIP